jgi:uncharacterized repeat protein (TIGR01451 family)
MPTFASGSTARWILTVANGGPSAAPDVVVTDSLPAGVALDETVTDNGCGLSGPATLTCAVGAVLPGSQLALEVGGMVDAHVDAGTTIINSAAVTSSATDLNSVSNGAAAATGVIHLNDLSVDVKADRTEVLAGDQANYTINLTNTGPSIARNVLLTTELPAELTDAFAAGRATALALLPTAIPANCTRAGPTATCPLANLAAGATATLQFSGHVATDTPAGTALRVIATVSADGSDNATANNSDSDVIVVASLLAPPTTAPARPPSSGGALPPTGMAVLGLIALATSLALSGGGLRLVARRKVRRRQH